MPLLLAAAKEHELAPFAACVQSYGMRKLYVAMVIISPDRSTSYSPVCMHVSVSLWVCAYQRADIVCIGKCQEKGMAEQLCGNYTTITDRQGRNALKGAIAFEGYAEGKIAIRSLCYGSHPDPCADPT